VYTRQPNSNYCFVCGRKNPRGLYMVFYDDGENEVFSEYTVGEEYQGYPGIVHGGVIASMLDEVVARVAMIGDPHHFMLSVKLQVKYRQAVPTSTPIKVVGRIVKLRGRLGRAIGQVLLPDGQVAAEAEMTLADVPDELTSGVNMESLGWYVDPFDDL